MKKIWYIYVGGHLGPFNAEEIFRLYYQHQIDEKTFLWRRGEKDWRRLEDFPEIYHILHPEVAELGEHLTASAASSSAAQAATSAPNASPLAGFSLREPDPGEMASEAEIPPLPEFVSAWHAPSDAAVPGPAEKGAAEGSPLAADAASSLGPQEPSAAEAMPARQAIEQSMKDNGDRQVSERFLDEYLAEQDDSWTGWRPAFRGWHYGLVAALLALAAVVAVIVWPYFGHPVHITADQEFWQVVHTSPAKGILTTLRAAPNFSEVYLASNMPGDATVHLILQAKPQRVLATGPIRASAQAFYHNGVAVFSTLVLEQGLGLAEGFYEYQIRAAKQDPTQRWKWWWKMWQHDRPPVWLGQDDLWAAQGEIYLGQAKDFDLRHAEFLAQQQVAQQAWHDELLEQGKTIHGILGQLTKLGLSEITSWRKAADVAHFVTAYQRQIMPFLQALVEEKSFHLAGDMSKAEQDLRRLAQRMAAAAMDLEAAARQKAKIKKIDRQQLRTSWQQQMQSLETFYQNWRKDLLAKTH